MTLPTLVKIAVRNIGRHVLSSLVLVLVLTAATVALFWAFGFGNSVAFLIEDAYRDSYGDIAFFTGFFDRHDVEELLADIPRERMVLDRELMGLSISPRKTDIARVVELSPENRAGLERWIRPLRGRVPEAEDELMIPELFLHEVYDVGDYLYIVVSTVDGIVNTLRYTIVGVSKTTGIKGLPTGYLITQDSVSRLIDSNRHANVVYLNLEEPLRTDPAALQAVYREVKQRLVGAGVEIRNSWVLPDELKRFDIYITVLEGLKVMIIVILFPLVGGVVASLVWIYSHKRRHEIWTVHALGLRDSRIFVTLATEYWVLSAAGYGLGILLGFWTSGLTVHLNIWLQFSYTFISPLMARIRGRDLAMIAAYLFGSVSVWMVPPILKVVRSRPFSY